MVKISTKDMLTDINLAITAIQNGAQSYKVGNQSVTKANLATLYAERERLERKAAEEDAARNGGNIFIGKFAGR